MKLIDWYFRRRRYASRWQRRLVQLLALSRCEYCGRFTRNDHAVVDHITPWSQGGWSSILNFAFCCSDCNHAKGGRTPRQWKPVTLAHFRQGMPRKG